MQNKKIPMRMCTGCGEMFPKRALVRIVKNKDGAISLDMNGRAPGRGAYICNNIECFKKAVKARRLEKALSGPIPEAVFTAIEEELSSNEK